MTMKLYGSNLSPYTRRCTIALTLAGQDFELLSKMTGPDEAEIRQHNPLGRLPFMLMGGGKCLIDSATIIRWLDQQTDAFRPAGAGDDLACEEIMALANGVCEKAMGSFYERTRRPEEFLWQGWVERCSWQVSGGLEELNRRYAQARPYAFGAQLTYADIYTFVALQFTQKTCPALATTGTFPALDALAHHMEALDPVFAASKP